MSSSEIAKLETRWRENPHGLTFAPLAEAYRKQREPARALEVLAEGLARHPDYIPASIVLGRCHLDLADDAQAETAFLRVLELDDENVIALKALADIHERQGRHGDAAGRLRSLLAVDRSNDEARAQLARVELAAREPEQGKAEPAPFAASTTQADETLNRDDYVWDEPALEQPVESAAHADLLVEDNLRPDGEVAPLDDILVDEPPVLDPREAAAMPGLVGEDFPAHRAGVVPLADLAPGTAAIGEHTSFAELDRQEEGPVRNAELRGESEPEPSAGAAEAASIEPIGDLERSAEIELSPSGASEFQLGSVSDEWAAGRLGDETAGDTGDSMERVDSAFAYDELREPHVEEAFPSEAVDDFQVADEPAVEPFPPDTSDSESEPAFAAEPPQAFASEAGGDDYENDEEGAAPPLPDDLVVTESMAELFLRQGHRAEALLVYRELYHRNRDDLRLREKVDSLETALAAEEAASPRGRSYAAPDRGRSVASFLSGIFGARPASAPTAWIATPTPAAPAPATTEAAADSGDAAPTRPASDHLSLSDVFGETGSPVPPAVAATAGASATDDGMSFDAFFGEAAGSSARTRGGMREDEDLDQFHAWLQNLKR